MIFFFFFFGVLCLCEKSAMTPRAQHLDIRGLL